MVAEPFRVIAHRGASAYAPENTLAAFRKAVQIGVSEIETDIGLTKDRKLLLFHDRTLDRTTNGTGLPADYTLEELKRLDAGSWMEPNEYPDFKWDEDFSGERLITLDELFEAFGNTLTYHIEIKDRVEGIVPAAIECIQKYDVAENSFIAIIDDESFLLEAKRLDSRIRTEFAPNKQWREKGAEAIEAVAKSGHDMVTLSAFNHSKELVDIAHNCGIEARSSGIKNRQHMIDAVEMGCNGMTINWPDWLIEYISQR